MHTLARRFTILSLLIAIFAIGLAAAVESDHRTAAERQAARIFR